MNNAQLKKEFQKHMNSRQCEKPSPEMLYEFFLEGFKLAGGKTESEKPTKKKRGKVFYGDEK